jgi:hypothetical protein
MNTKAERFYLLYDKVWRRMWGVLPWLASGDRSQRP